MALLVISTRMNYSKWRCIIYEIPFAFLFTIADIDALLRYRHLKQASEYSQQPNYYYFIL
jgi:hypothetical protein